MKQLQEKLEEKIDENGKIINLIKERVQELRLLECISSKTQSYETYSDISMLLIFLYNYEKPNNLLVNSDRIINNKGR